MVKIFSTSDKNEIDILAEGLRMKINRDSVLLSGGGAEGEDREVLAADLDETKRLLERLYGCQ